MTDRFANLFFYCCAAILAGSLAVSGARVTWHIAGYDESPLPAAFAEMAEKSHDAKIEIEAILALAPFGSLSGKTDPTIGDQPVSDLVLRGVFVAPNRMSRALIASETGPAKLYAQGQTIAGGAVLQDVLPDHVVIQREGQRQVLLLSKKPAAGVTAPHPAASGIVPGFASTVPSQPISASPAAPDEIIDRYRQEIAANPQSVLDNLGVAATPQGYSVGQNLSSAVARSGLLAGDLIVRVNGVGVGNIERDRQLFEQIAAAGNARVELLRGGRMLTLTFPLR